MILLGLLFSFSTAFAATPVEFKFTKESSREWVKAFHEIDDANALCSAQLLRPDRNDPLLKSAANQITCSIPSRNETITDSLEDTSVDSWGNYDHTIASAIQGGALFEKMIHIFREKTRDVSDTMKEGEMWSKSTTCAGTQCNQMFYLNATGSIQTAAQIACVVQTDISLAFLSPSTPQVYGIGSENLDDIIDQQVASGMRIEAKKHCIFMAP